MTDKKVFKQGKGVFKGLSAKHTLPSTMVHPSLTTSTLYYACKDKALRAKHMLLSATAHPSKTTFTLCHLC